MKRGRGAVLLVVLGLLIVLSIAALGSLWQAALSVALAQHDRAQLAAFAAAENALARAQAANAPPLQDGGVYSPPAVAAPSPLPLTARVTMRRLPTPSVAPDGYSAGELGGFATEHWQLEAFAESDRGARARHDQGIAVVVPRP